MSLKYFSFGLYTLWLDIERRALCCFYEYICVCILQQDSCGEEDRPSLVTVVKTSAKPRRARLLSKGRKLNNRKRGRPKKAAPVAEKKNKKNQSALDLLHAKTLSAAPPQGQTTHTCTHTTLNSSYFTSSEWEHQSVASCLRNLPLF